MKSCEAAHSRADTRLISLFQSEIITEVHLEHRFMREEGTIALAKTLTAHDETETLSLVNASLDDSSSKHISEVLEKLNIKKLNLSRNKITSSSLEELSKGISQNISLTELNLSHNQISDEGLNLLYSNIATKPLLNILNLNNNKITNEGIQSMIQHLGIPDKNFPQINFSRNELGDDGMESISIFLKKNPSVTHINLSGTGIGNNGILRFVDQLMNDENGTFTLDSLNLSSLDLSDNLIGIEGVIALGKFVEAYPKLTHLNVSNNKDLTGDALLPLLNDQFILNSLSINRIH